MANQNVILRKELQRKGRQLLKNGHIQPEEFCDPIEKSLFFAERPLFFWFCISGL
jgi:hypothetical protein